MLRDELFPQEILFVIKLVSGITKEPTNMVLLCQDSVPTGNRGHLSMRAQTGWKLNFCSHLPSSRF